MVSSRTSIFGLSSALMAVLPALGAAQATGAQTAAPVYVPPEYHDGQMHYERREDNFGRFTVVRYIEDCRAVPMLDYGCWLKKEAQFKWHGSTKSIGFSIIDNGYGVSFRPELSSSDGKSVCISQSILVGYDPRPSTVQNWNKLQPFIGQQIHGCSFVAPADVSRALAEMQSSGADYIAAAIAWQAHSVELFGSGGRRCIHDRMVKPVTMPPRYECSEFSKP